MAEARIDSNVVRYARGRRPFLCKKVVNSSQELAEEECRESDEPWWTEKSQLVREWLKSNPLHLGMDDEAVQLVRAMLRKGDETTDETKQKRCWSHICIEMATVPGNPLVPQDHAFVEDMLEQASKPQQEEEPKSPETEDVPHTLPVSTARNNEQQAVEEKQVVPVAASDSIDVLQKSQESKKEVTRIDTSVQGKTKQKSSQAGSHSARKPERQSSLRSVANSVMKKKSLSSMSLIERQEFMLQKKKEKAERILAQQKEKEVEGCTYKPQKFTRRSTFTNVESIVKQQASPSKGSMPPRNMSTEEALLNSNSAATLHSDTSVTEQAANFLEECKTLMRENQSVTSLSSGTDQQESKKRVPRRRKTSKTKELEKALDSSALLEACKGELQKSRTQQEEEEEEEEEENNDDAKETNEKMADERMQDAEQREGEAKEEEPASKDDEAENNNEMEEGRPIPGSRRSYKFAANSTEHRGKIEVQDFHAFQLDSFYRKRDRGSSKPGVTLLMGRREDDLTEQVVAVIFDRSKFTEEEASDWMNLNLHRFPTGHRLLRSKGK